MVYEGDHAKVRHSALGPCFNFCVTFHANVVVVYVWYACRDVQVLEVSNFVQFQSSDVLGVVTARSSEPGPLTVTISVLNPEPGVVEYLKSMSRVNVLVCMV